MAESSTVHTRRCLQHLRTAWHASSPHEPFCPSDRFPADISSKTFEQFSTEQQMTNHLKRAAKGMRATSSKAAPSTFEQSSASAAVTAPPPAPSPPPSLAAPKRPATDNLEPRATKKRGIKTEPIASPRSRGTTLFGICDSLPTRTSRDGRKVSLRLRPFGNCFRQSKKP